MKIETTRFGIIEIQEENIIIMPNGLLGFPDSKRYCILQHKENSPFFWLQSIDAPGLAVVVTNPWLFKPDYHVDFNRAIEHMSWESGCGKASFDCYVIVTIPKGEPKKMTANLIGPVILNLETKEAVQMVLPDDRYSVKHSLFSPDV